MKATFEYKTAMEIALENEWSGKNPFGLLYEGAVAEIASIPQANWKLIRVVPPGTVDRIDRNLDQRNRQDIEQDIFMERELFAW